MTTETKQVAHLDPPDFSGLTSAVTYDGDHVHLPRQIVKRLRRQLGMVDRIEGRFLRLTYDDRRVVHRAQVVWQEGALAA